LFSRKMDIERTHVLLRANWKWRKENKFIQLPTIDEINLEVFHTFFGIPGARTEDGCGLLYATVNPDHVAGQEPWTVASVTKAATFFNFIGVFLEGMDYVRNGICIAMDLGNFGWNHWEYSFWYGMGGMWTDTFPMLMKRIAIINPPLILSGLLKLASLFVKKKIMSRIAVLGEEETENILEHLEGDTTQVSKKFGGSVEFTWDQYEVELREFCKENQTRLIALPEKEKKKKGKSDDDSYSVSHYSEIEAESKSPESQSETSGEPGPLTPKKKNKGPLNISMSAKKKDKDKSPEKK